MTTTNGKWAIEDYTVEEDGRKSCRHRLLHDGKVVIDPVHDAGDLFNLVAFSLVQAGFASLAETYRDKKLYEDDTELDIMGPGSCPASANEILAYCRGGLAALPMPNEVCADLDLPPDSTYAQGVEQFRKGYKDHATCCRQWPTPRPEERAKLEADHKARAEAHPEEEAWLKELGEMS